MTRSTSTIVVLIGLRGAGKTTLGRLLAEALSWTFEDLDALALRHSGADSVAEVFRTEGEAGWRTHEAKAFENALEQSSLVLALGGGAPTVEAIRRRINEARGSGRLQVLWLDAPDAILASRLADHGSGRPALLQDAAGAPLGPLEECRQLRSARSADFEAITDRRIDCDGPPQTVLERLLKVIGPTPEGS